MTPAPPQQSAATEPATEAPGTAHLVTRLFGATVALAAGMALLALPWTDAWEKNYFANLGAHWNALWLSPYFRGAVSGLGAANLYLALSDLLWLRRPAQAR